MNFTINCSQGLIHTHLIDLLSSKGWTYIPFEQITPDINIDFAWIGGTIGGEYLKFDEKVYSIKTSLKNIIYGSGVKGDYKNKDTVTNKYELYYNVCRISPEIAKKHLCESYDLKRLTYLQPNQILIARPVGVGTGGGNGISMITNDNELIQTKFSLSRKYKYILASDYIINPLLFESKKFHLRMYWMVYPDTNNQYKHSLLKIGKIITALHPYQNNDWHNKRIHDSHFKSTIQNRYFPNDLGLPMEITDNLFQQMTNILEVAFAVLLPNIQCFEDTKYGFEVFGCDFMITTDLIIKCIEINAKHDYGVNDLQKENSVGHNYFCKEFYNWIYSTAIVSIFNET